MLNYIRTLVVNLESARSPINCELVLIEVLLDGTNTVVKILLMFRQSEWITLASYICKICTIPTSSADLSICTPFSKRTFANKWIKLHGYLYISPILINHFIASFFYIFCKIIFRYFRSLMFILGVHFVYHMHFKIDWKSFSTTVLPILSKNHPEIQCFLRFNKTSLDSFVVLLSSTPSNHLTLYIDCYMKKPSISRNSTCEKIGHTSNWS